jgi:hypothetical protein
VQASLPPPAPRPAVSPWERETPAPVPAAAPEPRSHKTAFVLGGVAAASLVAGAVLGLKSRSAGNELANGMHSRSEVESLAGTKQGAAVGANVLFLLGAGLGLGAVIAW